MRGALISIPRRLALLGLSLLLLGCFIVPPKSAYASGSFDLARDTIASVAPQLPQIFHDIYFVLPVDAQQVTPSDWITIDFPNYTLLNDAAVFLSGAYNNDPSISLSDHTLRITGIVVLPGRGVEVNGLMATNPPQGEANNIRISASDNAEGLNPRNSIVVLPTDSKNLSNATATVQSPLSGLTISGSTSPNGFVTLTSGLSILATAIADNSGNFNFIVTGLNPGNYTFIIFATDSAGRNTAQSSLSLSLLSSLVTSVTGLLLSSTISADKTAIKPGETITISGTAKPNSQITLFVEAPLRSYTTTTNEQGIWSYTISAHDSANLAPGQYQAYTVVQDSDGAQSAISPTISFTVLSPDNSANPPPNCDISHGDLNCNHVTNLVDFSILLFHWNTNHRVADINKDGTVNLVDFSIMMFYFTN